VTEARKKLLDKEKAFTRERDALNAERRRPPVVRIDKDYHFTGPDGSGPTLDDLFEGHQRPWVLPVAGRGFEAL
jgi:predicted dithiol-disulfide oxidoreductase (DUF899 family)